MGQPLTKKTINKAIFWIILSEQIKIEDKEITLKRSRIKVKRKTILSLSLETLNL